MIAFALRAVSRSARSGSYFYRPRWCTTPTTTSSEAPTTTAISIPMAPIAPVMPEEHECCGNECGTDCVWSLYFEDQKLYLDEKRAWERQQQQKADNDTDRER